MSASLLAQYDVSPVTGFVKEYPLSDLPQHFEQWQRFATNVSTLSPADIRSHVANLPLLNHHNLIEDPQRQLAHVYLSTIASAFVWCQGEKNAPAKLPPQLAIPLWNVASGLGVKPIVCHADGVLWNTLRTGKPENGFLDDYKMIGMKFIPERDIDNFFMVTSKLEVKFAPGIQAIWRGVRAAECQDFEEFNAQLGILQETISVLGKTLAGMHTSVDPMIFYRKIRPYLAGYDEKSLPASGMLFEGVSENPHVLCGGSAAQSTIFQALDTFLGVAHPSDSQQFLEEMRSYMPRPHRDLLGFLDKKQDVLRRMQDENSCCSAVESCIQELRNFRTKHIRLVCSYITTPANSGDAKGSLKTRGTGGTGYSKFLKSVRDSTI